jgi:hypothetical protein
MPKFIIEREIPGAGNMNDEELQAAAAKSCGVVSSLNADYHWITSYVTGDKIYCVHVAPDEATVRKHAEQSGFPAHRISEIKTNIDAATAERAQAVA